VLFEELGFKYIGPVDGHDIPALLNVLQQARSMKGAVLLHVRTTKGKGYNIAEKSPSSYHGVGTFCVKTGKPMTKPSAPSYTDVFSKHLCRRAARDSRIVAITAAMSDGTGLERFKERFPKRFFDVGIAEGHAVTFAAGLAKGGLRPVFAVYSSFLQRAYDQILHDVAVQNLPVIFAIDHAGAVCRDGETHQGIYDIAFLSHIPNIVILAPSSGAELNEMLDFALNHDGPVAIRYPKEVAPEDFSEELLLHNGKKIAIVSVGAMLDTARQVAEKFSAEQNESVGLYNARFVKPIAPDLIAQLRKYDYVFTIEDGIKIGGFGEKLALSLSEENVKVHNFAFPDIFPETGTRTELFTRYELDAESIYKKIKTTIKEN
ncbi:MAG: 1-deoxy-D-xylulose-5-phosphate synthase, partial [Defluviitaleaceae bacterium]|nr:1-deoxy-D-xylulose-5-phosphate synthase [Defluviitaleaceae bacterium]